MRDSQVQPGYPTDGPDWAGDYGDRVAWGQREFVYCYSAVAVAKGGVVRVGAVGQTDGKNPQASAAATTAVPTEFGIATAALTGAGDVWVQVKGPCSFALVEGTTDVAVGDALQGVNAQNYLVKDGGATATADTIAIATAAQATNAAAASGIYLLGRAATIG